MGFRRNLARIHKWCGLTIALLLALQSLTGLLLVYRAELHSAWPGNEHVITNAPHGQTRISVDSVLQRARESYPDHVFKRLIYPSVEGQPFVGHLSARDGELLILEITMENAWPRLAESGAAGAFHLLFEIHHTLVAGVIGRYIVGLIGISLIFLVVSGIWVWWPGIRGLQRSLRVGRYRHPVTFFWRLHRTVGVLGALLLLLLSVTGVLLSFSPELRRLADTASGPEWSRPASSPCTGVSVDEQVEAARRCFAGAAVRDLRFVGPEATLQRVLFRNATAAGVGPPHQVWLKPCTTEALGVKEVRNSPFAAVMSWLYPVHTGWALGEAGRALSLTGGLVTLGSLSTGLLLWYQRRRKKALAT